jgi:phosphoribosylformylglycinamidine cyclo-ligase
MAHLTGGSFVENLPRVLPETLAARIVTQSWETPPLFRKLVQWSGMAREEAYRVFNMGIGMALIIPAGAAEAVLDRLPDAVVIGRLKERKHGAGVELIFPEA